MALWTVAFLGITPIGGPIIGFIGEHFGARWALAIGGFAALLAAAYGWYVVHAHAAALTPTNPTPALAPTLKS